MHGRTIVTAATSQSRIGSSSAYDLGFSVIRFDAFVCSKKVWQRRLAYLSIVFE